MGQPCPVCGHAVARLHRAQHAGLLVGAVVAHHADAAHGQQHGEGLPQRRVEVRRADFFVHDGVGPAQHVQARFGDLAQAAHREPRAGEGVAPEHVVRHAHGLARAAHLVLEQLAQRLDQLELHAFGQAADVVVALDHRARSAHADALDHVRVERALHEPLDVLDLRGVLVEDLDELAADDLALLLGIGDARERVEEALSRVGDHQVQVETLPHGVLDRVAFVGAQEAIVHEDADQAIAQRFVAEHRRHRRVDAAREPADHALIGADLRDHRRDGLVDEGAGGPVWLEPGDVEEERPQHLGAARRVGDLRVELNPEQLARRIADGAQGGAWALAQGAEAGRQRGQPVAMAHPDRELVTGGERREQPDGLLHHQLRRPVFAVAARLDLAPELVGHELLAVADAQHRHAEIEEPRIALGRLVPVHALGAAREDDGPGREGADGVEGERARMDLAVHARLADPTRDELSGLRPVVEDEHEGTARHAGANTSSRAWRTVSPSTARGPRFLWWRRGTGESAASSPDRPGRGGNPATDRRCALADRGLAPRAGLRSAVGRSQRRLRSRDPAPGSSRVSAADPRCERGRPPA